MSTIVPQPGSEPAPDETAHHDAMPIDELAALFCAVQEMGIRERLDPEQRFAHLLVAECYFDHLPHRQPARAFALICAVLASHARELIKIRLCDSLMAPLVYFHGAEMAGTIEAEAQRDPRMRWLLGGTFEWTPDDALCARLEKSADADRWTTDRWTASQVAPVDFASLATPELARAWIAEKSKPSWQDDENVRALQAFEEQLRDDPQSAAALVIEIARIEDNDVLLFECAAPLLANALTEETIDRIERAADAKVATMLALIDYSDADSALRTRLEAIERKHLRDRPPFGERPIAAGDFISRAAAWAQMPLPRIEMVMRGPGFFDDPDAVPVGRRATLGPRVRMALDKLPVDELVPVWRANQLIELRRQTEETRYTEEYFDYLPHEQPERALALAIAVLRSDAEKAVKVQLEDKFIGVIINAGRPDLVDAIEAEARVNPQMRWLLGGIGWAIGDGEIAERLARVADAEAWRADAALQRRPHAIDFTTLSTAELARAFVDLHALHRKLQLRDESYQALVHFQHRLAKQDPDAAIDLVLEVLRIEANLALLEILARDVLFPAVKAKTIKRIERESAANARFARMVTALANHWSDPPKTIARRLDAIRRAYVAGHKVSGASS
jgi:hypothetical protein